MPPRQHLVDGRRNVHLGVVEQHGIFGWFQGRSGAGMRTAPSGCRLFSRKAISILGGAASIRFHRPPAGIGLSPVAQPHVKSARMLVSVLDVFRAMPDAAGERLKNDGDNRAYLMYVPGEIYAVYFPNGGEAGLELNDAPGTFSVRWLDAAAGAWRDAGRAARAGL